MDNIALVLSLFNKELVSVDFWKSYSLSPLGLRYLMVHKNLEEIDLGWWLVYFMDFYCGIVDFNFLIHKLSINKLFVI